MENKKTKRVGLYSMGLVLIITGVLIFLSQILDFKVWNIVIKIWPLVLIVLGVEVLWFNYKSNSEENIKISILSIIIIFLILFFNLGIYSVIEVGLLDKFESYINMESFTLENSGEYKFNENIDKVVINEFIGNRLDINVKDVDNINYIEKIKVEAENQEEANSKNKNTIIFKEIGNILYIDLNKDASGFNDTHLSIDVPAYLDMEIEENGKVDLTFYTMKSNILVDNIDTLDLRLNENLNMEVLTEFEEGNSVIDETRWNIEKESKKVGDETVKLVKGNIKINDGKYKLNVLNTNSIKVNRI